MGADSVTLRQRLSFLGVSRSPAPVPLLVLIGDHAYPLPTVGEIFDVRRMRAYHPVYVLTVQAEGARPNAAVADEVHSAIARLRASRDVDPRRVYLVGEARGADLVWRLLESSPDDYAAAVAANGRVVGLAGSGRADRIAGVPIWVFQDAESDRVPVEAVRATVGALWAVGSTVRYTEYRDQEPDRWAALRREDRLLAWLFMQSRD